VLKPNLRTESAELVDQWPGLRRVEVEKRNIVLAKCRVTTAQCLTSACIFGWLLLYGLSIRGGSERSYYCAECYERRRYSFLGILFGNLHRASLSLMS
jgi:hypothetical protein